jgi:hypothetical protein
MRAESLNDLTGDLRIICTGGTPTAANVEVPKVNIQVSLNTNITSRLLASANSGLTIWDEALLIIDEPNTPFWNNTPDWQGNTRANRALLNCGRYGEDNDPAEGKGNCAIVSTGDPKFTYDGVVGYRGTATCDGSNAYACTRPNVFQGRKAASLLASQDNQISFLGVPLDPPGANWTRTLRVTNLRGDGTRFGVTTANPFTTVNVVATISFSGSTTLLTSNITTTVGQVQLGLGSAVTSATYLQCQEQAIVNSVSPTVRLIEGFSTAWKVRNFAQTQANGSYVSGWTYGNTQPSNYVSTNVAQNVPGAIYNTETGFLDLGRSDASTTIPGIVLPQNLPTFPAVYNPPPGTGVVQTNFYNPGGSAEFFDDTTNTQAAGLATQGTRFTVANTSIPAGSQLWYPNRVFLRNKSNGAVSGVLWLNATGTSNGGGGFTKASTTSGYTRVDNAGGLATYEVLYSDPFAEEYADIFPQVVYTLANLGSNLPETQVTAQATVSFAPFYDPVGSANLPQGDDYPTPRFIRTGTPQGLYTIVKCACNLLFPWVSSAAGFDTGIVISNTSKDPGATAGFLARPQQGKVTFWYYGSTGVNGPAATPDPQTSTNVTAGYYVTHVLSQDTSLVNGLKARLNFAGYVIAQSEFQYCHGVAYLSPVGASAGTTLGYLGLQLDTCSQNGPTCLPRTLVPSEANKH